MLEAAQTLRDLTAGLSVAGYLVNRKTQLAVERAIEILSKLRAGSRRPCSSHIPRFRGQASPASGT
jgi:hypothetical protein